MSVCSPLKSPKGPPPTPDIFSLSTHVGLLGRGDAEDPISSQTVYQPRLAASKAAKSPSVHPILLRPPNIYHMPLTIAATWPSRLCGTGSLQSDHPQPASHKRSQTSENRLALLVPPDLSRRHQTALVQMKNLQLKLLITRGHRMIHSANDLSDGLLLAPKCRIRY